MLAEKTRFAMLPGLHKSTSFAPDSRSLVSLQDDGSCILWDLQTATLICTLRGHLLGIHSVAFSPDGRRLATGGSAGNEAVKLWDTATHQEVLTLEGKGSLFRNLQFSPDGNTILAINVDGLLHLWNAPSFRSIESDPAPISDRH